MYKVIFIIPVILIFICIWLTTRKVYESFSNHLPSIQFIVLKNYKNRVHNVHELINKEGIQNYTIFDAIDGSRQNRLQLMRDGKLNKNTNSLRLGVIGCSLSHITIWKQFIKSSNGDLLILEDDINLANNFNKQLSLVMRHLPTDYDICYLQERKNLDQRFKNTPINKYIRSGWPQYGTIGYLISKKGAKRLLTYCDPIYQAIDVMISDVVKRRDIKCYITRENLVSHTYKFTSVVCGVGKHCKPSIT